MEIAIIIINHKDIVKLERAINSIVFSKIPEIIKRVHLIVVDCCSDYYILNKLISIFKNSSKNIVFQIIHLTKDIGPSEQHNLGFKMALHLKPKYIIFLDNDVEVSDNWLEKAIKFMELHKDVAAAQFMLLSLHDKQTIDRYCNLVDVLLFGYHPLIGIDYNKVKNIIKPRTCFYPDGAAFIARTEALKKIMYNDLSIYNTEFFVIADDLDFGWRIWLSGQRVMIIPDAIVYHMRSFKNITISERHIYYQVRNKLFSIIINYQLKNLLKFLPLYLSIMILLTILFYRRNPRFSIAIVKGIKDVIKYYRRIITKRLYVQRYIRKVRDEFLINDIILPISIKRLYDKFKLLT